MLATRRENPCVQLEFRLEQRTSALTSHGEPQLRRRLKRHCTELPVSTLNDLVGRSLLSHSPGPTTARSATYTPKRGGIRRIRIWRVTGTPCLSDESCGNPKCSALVPVLNLSGGSRFECGGRRISCGLLPQTASTSSGDGCCGAARNGRWGNYSATPRTRRPASVRRWIRQMRRRRDESVSLRLAGPSIGPPHRLRTDTSPAALDRYSESASTPTAYSSVRQTQARQERQGPSTCPYGGDTGTPYYAVAQRFSPFSILGSTSCRGLHPNWTRSLRKL